VHRKQRRLLPGEGVLQAALECCESAVFRVLLGTSFRPDDFVLLHLLLRAGALIANRRIGQFPESSHFPFMFDGVLILGADVRLDAEVI
jgi:hypothetical protein